MKKPTRTRRTNQVHVLFSSEEKERLRELAAREGRSMAGWLRSRIRQRYEEMKGRVH